MKKNTKVVTKLEVSTENDLEKFVFNWLNEKATDYDSGIKGVLEDLFHGGCASGFVSDLIYYSDTIAFYRDHKDDIWDLAIEQAEEVGHKNVFEMLAILNGTENVGGTDQFENLMAWYAFEETARRLADRAGIEV